MTDFRNYIYRLAEGISGKRIQRIDEAIMQMYEAVSEASRGLQSSIHDRPEPIKTAAGRRYDA